MKLTKEEVLHVANLAKINISEEEVEKYRVELKKLIDDIDKIKEVNNYDDDFMFSPVTHNAIPVKDEPVDGLSTCEIMVNVPKVNGNFVEVPVMLNE